MANKPSNTRKPQPGENKQGVSGNQSNTTTNKPGERAGTKTKK